MSISLPFSASLPGSVIVKLAEGPAPNTFTAASLKV